MRLDLRAATSACLGAALLLGCDFDESLAVGEGPERMSADAAGGTIETDDESGDSDESGFETDANSSDGPEESDDCDAPSPYAGGWEVGCCQDDIVPSPWEPDAIEPGLVLPDWTFIDQYGESVRLYDFCHEAIYFEYVAMWCTSCQAHAPVVAGLFDTYADRGLMTLTFMSESWSGGAPSQSDVTEWANTFGHDGLVVYSETATDVWYPFAEVAVAGSYSISLPGTMFVAPGMAIARLGVPTLQDIESLLPHG